MAIQSKKYTSKKTGKTSTKYFACVYDPVTDKHRWGKGRSKRTEAVKDEAELITQIENGELELEKSQAFSRVADIWFESIKDTYAESTLHSYDGYYRTNILPIFGDIMIDKIKPIHVQNYKNELSKKYKPATINKIIMILRLIFEFARKPLNLIRENPCKDIKRSKIMPPEWTTWDTKTIGYFLNLPEVMESKYYEMLIVSFTTALRPGEVCGIWTSDLMKDGTLALKRGFNKHGHITEMKTRRSHRPLTLDPFVFHALQIKKKKKLEEKKRYVQTFQSDIPYNENDFLFTHENGNPVQPDTYSRNFRYLVNRHNEKLKKYEDENNKLPDGDFYLPHIRLYDGRHSFATNTIIDGNENVKVISEIMGSSVETIMNNYVHTQNNAHQATLSSYSNKIFNFEGEKERLKKI